jgi:NitT/TauT family transport system substrate-binding protein
MKIRSAIYTGAGVTVAIILVVTFFGYETTQQEKIRLAYFPNISHVVPIVGLETGIFEKEFGNQTIIETKLFDSGPEVIESMFADTIDIAYVGPGPAIHGFLHSKNNNMKILAIAASGGASFVVHPDSEIKSVNDFSGKRIAAPQIGNTQDVSLRSYLKDQGLKPVEKGGTVYILDIANPEIYTLFSKGDIDAAWVPEPLATILVQQLGGIRLFYEEDLWPQKKFASVVLIARSDYIQQNPMIIQALINSHVKTIEWINQHPDETKKIFNQFRQKTLGKPIPDSILNEAFSNIKITSEPLDETIYTFAERAHSLGYLGRESYNLDGIFYNNGSNNNLQEPR